MVEHHRAYLAGKITKNGWRSGYGDYREHSIMGECSPYEELVVNEELTITGPFFIGCDHGCYHGNGGHGVAAREAHDLNDTDKWFDCLGTRKFYTRNDVFEICKNQIDKAEIVFAYIDCLDCYGTLAEIGYAYAKGKAVEIFFASPTIKEEMWFISKMHRRVNYISEPWIARNLVGEIIKNLF